MTARALSVTYGAETIGNTEDRQIDGTVEVSVRGSVAFELTFGVVVTAATDAAFSTACQTLQDAVRTPYQDLSVSFQGQTTWDFRQSVGKAFNVQGDWQKDPDGPASRLARRYILTFEGELAADRTAGQPAGLRGWREATVDIAYDEANIRTVTIEGEWTGVPFVSTAQPAMTARDAYEDATTGSPAYASLVLTAIDPNSAWETPNESVNLVDSDFSDLGEGGVLQYRLVYRELVHNQAGEGQSGGTVTAGVQTGSIYKQRLHIARERVGPGDSPGTVRLLKATATYEAWIDKNQTTNLESFWNATIRPYIATKIRSSDLLSSAIAVTSERPNFDYDANKITATMEAMGFGGPIIERRITMEDKDIGGHETVPVWSGNKRARYHYDAPLERTRTIAETARVLIDISPDIDLASNMGAGILGDLGGVIIAQESSVTPVVIGTTEGGGQLRIQEISGRMTVKVFDATDGARLQGSSEDAGANPFLFDFNLGVFDVRSNTGFARATPAVDLGFGPNINVPPNGFVGDTPSFQDVVLGS